MAERKTGKKKKKCEGSGKNTSFYSRVLDQAEKLDIELVLEVDGIDDEIALLRVEIMKALEGGDAENLKLLIRATNALARLIHTRYQITREQRKGIKEAIGNVLRDVALPLGVGIGTALGK